jgi:hypothetical protein
MEYTYFKKGPMIHNVFTKIQESHSSWTTEDCNVRLLQTVDMYLHNNLHSIIYQLLVCIYNVIYTETYPKMLVVPTYQ